MKQTSLFIKTKILLSLLLIPLLLIACSTDERSENEVVYRSFAEGMGMSSSEIDEMLANLSDKELREAVSYMDQDGNFDLDRLLEETFEEEIAEREELANDLSVRSLEVECQAYEDPASRRLTQTNVHVLPCTAEYGGLIGGCDVKTNIEGELTLRIYGIQEIEADFWSDFEKGNLLIEESGSIQEIAPLSQENRGFLGARSSFLYQFTYDDLPKEKIQYTRTDFEPDQYGRTYVHVPLVVEAILIDTEGNEFVYTDYIDEYAFCSSVQEQE